MSLMGYTEQDVDVMAGQLIEAACFVRDNGDNPQLVEGILQAWSFLDGMLEEGRV
jgi:hypothetical protein